MSAQARYGDFTDISCPHGGIGMIITGSEYTFIDNLKISRLSDEVVCLKCGKSGNIITGSFFSFTDNLNNAKIGDTCVGDCDIGEDCCPHSRTGEVSTGSPYTFTE